MPQNENEYSNCWLTAVQLEDDCSVKPMDIIAALQKDDVESRPIWKPLHLQPVFNGCDFITRMEKVSIVDIETGADNSVAGMIFYRGMCLPSDSKMTAEDLERVCKVVRALWQR